MGILSNAGMAEIAHALTEIYMIKQDASGQKKYVYLFHDPNAAFPWKRVAAENLKEVDEWKSDSLFIGAEDVETYHLDKGMLIGAYSEEALETLMQGGSVEPLSLADRRISNLPSGKEKFRLLGEMLTGGFEGSWFDMQQELHAHVRHLSETEIFTLLGGSERVNMHNLFMTLALGGYGSSSAIAYLRGLEDIPIADALKLRLIKESRKNKLVNFTH
jgi:hypothetical protein